jgi:eukaryotic-like serine/threonine-protein kinase
LPGSFSPGGEAAGNPYLFVLLMVNSPQKKMNLITFVRSRLFLKQLFIAFALGIFFIWGSLKLLDAYTHHGRTVTVPNLEGMPREEVGDVLKKQNLRYVINDSIFDDTRDKGTISVQDPAAGTEVKRNRTIYLTMVALMPEMVPMPDLIDLSYRQAVTRLETYGLGPGLLEYRPDIARNAVLEQKYQGGAIEPGTLVEKGTTIDLVLGEGLGENIVMVPMLIGETRQDAIQALHAATLNTGAEFFLDEDEEGDVWRVYRQNPDPVSRRHYLRAGSSVDLYYRSTEQFDFEQYLAELLTVPVPMLFGKTPDEVLEMITELELAIGEEVFEDNVGLREARVYRQEPEYESDAMIRKGDSIRVWYRSVDAFDDL